MRHITNEIELAEIKPNERYTYNCKVCGKLIERKLDIYHLDRCKSMLCMKHLAEEYYIKKYGSVENYKKVRYKKDTLETVREIEEHKKQDRFESRMAELVEKGPDYVQTFINKNEILKYYKSTKVEPIPLTNDKYDEIIRDIYVFHSIKAYTYLNCSNCGRLVNKRISYKNYKEPKESIFRCMPCNVKNTALLRYGDENYFQKNAAKQVSKVFNDEKRKNEISEKRKKTNLDKYGYANGNVIQITLSNKTRPIGDKQLSKIKSKETSIHKYGVEHPMQSEQIKNKLRETFNKKYGCWASSSKDIIEKVKQTNLEKYGVTCTMNSIENRKHRHTLYYYDGKNFDSSWELIFYLYLKSQSIDFTFHPEINIIYTVGNEQHTYEPDFLIGNKLFEIKGDHFFDNDGHLINPYNKKRLLEKEKCMIENNVVILRSNDLKDAFNFVKCQNIDISIYRKEKIND